MAFTYHHRVRFRETDAAGVAYFAEVLSVCHAAYEESLLQCGINLRDFFEQAPTAIPITHTCVDYLQPAFCGDLQRVYLVPHQLSEAMFEIRYEIFSEQPDPKLVSRALTRHVCIDRQQRRRSPIPAEMLQWLRSWSAPSSESD
ncbi:acyl-CoA thioesterase [Lyngbya confervoides]|uniref:1,4-dihydroxy-2-naphthoyl-CoA hydrolase n=1 Tax=Lyngbya confervoides BDU141951 TaxID=1574623 RepID=A0ABD4SZ73_9CYAN|nr:thioesterase family protein [Lyngbya confervoides]MCM1981446.1 acyl-CoA thioesterase [Lyngbya confervoides BDU141951]